MKLVALDEHGHLVNTDDWSEEFAQYLCKKDGQELTKSHWEVIKFVREYYLRHKIEPMPKVVIKELNRKYGDERYTIKHLYNLFPNTPLRNACRYAGVPHPSGCT